MAEKESPKKSAPATHGPAPISTEAVGTLRQLKETENAWAKKLADARARGETKIKYAQAARERTLADARRDAEQTRTQRLQGARTQAETEARQVLSDAKAEAARIGSLSSSDLDGRLDEVLSAVFADLRPSGSKGSAGSTKSSASSSSKGPASAR